MKLAEMFVSVKLLWGIYSFWLEMSFFPGISQDDGNNSRSL
ncbi:hypothetical protein ACE1B6_29365 [Aerosakkonemataceae cyanobacterium BLCC-F154]|uniref:Uncharacterized protein n=1 Tax=Floridaenema fluviatile BLCC-F154 TaxID=3153640 RepID=A0ABV4YKN0_9CYAN